MRVLAALFLSLCISTICPAQKETAHWILSAENRIKFNPAGGVTNQAQPGIYSDESVSISDSTGNFLFFSNGLKVFDKNLSPMPAFANPTSIIGYGNRHLQVAPYPGQPGKYFLFYTHQASFGANYTLKYAVIDMSLNGGLGDVTTYNNLVDTIIDPVFTIVNKQGTEDLWLVSHRDATDSFFSRPVTVSGVNPVPVISIAGMGAFKTEYKFLDLRASHDGKMIAGFAYKNYTNLFAYTVEFIEVFNFNQQSGTVTNKVKSKTRPGYFWYIGQIEFSPDNKLVYKLQSALVDGLQPCGFGSSLLTQYNLCYTDSTDFTDNAMWIGQTHSFCYLIAWGRMQTGADKKIYMPYAGTNKLSRIEYPNRLGSSCGVNLNYHTLNSGTGVVVPKFYHRYVEKAVKNNIIYNGGCFPGPIQFSVTNDTISTFQWDFGDPASGPANTSTLAAPQHQFTNPGFYTVSVNIFGSTGQLIETLTETIEIKNPAIRLLAQYPTDTSICEGESIRLKVNVINGIFQWFLRDTLGYFFPVAVADSIDTYISTPGTYVLQMKQGKCNPCILTDSITIHLLPKPNVNLGYDRDLCTGDSLQLNTYDPGATFLWSTGEATSSIWVTQGGTYWVRAEFNNNGCLSTDTVVITQRPGIQFNLGVDTTLCTSQTLLLSPGVSNASYLWQDGSASSSFLVTSPGTYWVRVSNQYGCIHRDTITVAYVNAQGVNLGADTSLCIGSQLILSVNIPGSTYLWNTGSTSSSLTINNTGQYWLRVDNGACTVTDTIQVTFAPIPVVSLGSDTSICAGISHTLRATISNAAYVWQNGSTGDTFNVTQPGIYWVNITRYGCSYSDSINIAYKPLPSANLGSDTSICTNESIILQAGDPSIQWYLWNTGSTNNYISLAAAGTYWVQITGINQCINRDTIVIAVNPLPQFSLGRDTSLCQNQSLLMQLNLNNATCLWNNGNQTNQYTITQPGMYWVDVTQIGCTKRDSIIVNYKPLPNVNLGNDTTLCEGITKTLDVTNPSSTYTWQNGNTGSSFTVNNAGLYFVAVNMDNCVKRDSIAIAYTFKPVFDLGKDTFICQGHQVVLTPRLNGSYNYLWQDGTNSPVYNVIQPGTYQLTVSNNCGAFTDKIVVDKGTCLILMPNAFTPNNDGLNDLFRLKYPGFIKIFKMVVYNRWGEKINETTNPLNGWDGKYKGILQPMGNYIWIISYTDIDGISATLKGNVILIR